RRRDPAPRAVRVDGRRPAGSSARRVPQVAPPVAHRCRCLAVAGGSRGGPAHSGRGAAAPRPGRLRAAGRVAAPAQVASPPRGRRGAAGGHLMRDAGRSMRWTLVLVAATVAVSLIGGAQAATKPRAILVVPFDASALGEDQWLGEGVAQVVSLGLAQHPAFVQVDRSRQRAMGRPDVWGEPVVVQAARALHVDAAIFGRVARTGSDYVVQPRLLELKGGAGEPVSLEPITASEADLLARLAPLAVAYARTLKVTLTEAEARRIDKAAQPTRSLKAFELYARGEMAMSQRPGQEGNEQAIDLLARAIEADPNFTVAYYAQGVVHQELGNRWKAASQFRAAIQLDPNYPEPHKALGDLFLAAPRRLFEQAVE